MMEMMMMIFQPQVSMAISATDNGSYPRYTRHMGYVEMSPEYGFVIFIYGRVPPFQVPEIMTLCSSLSPGVF